MSDFSQTALGSVLEEQHLSEHPTEMSFLEMHKKNLIKRYASTHATSQKKLR